MKNTNYIKKILLILLIIGTFAGAFVGSWLIFNQGTYDLNIENLAVFDDDSSKYYLKKTDKNIIFEIECEDSNIVEYVITDNSGSPINTELQKRSKNTYNILPPKQGYIEGQQYILSLPDNVFFKNQSLKNARTLIFTIDKEEIETYSYTDAVVLPKNQIADVIDSKLDVTDYDLKIGDVVLGQNSNGEYVAYKVESIENEIANVITPAIDDIYSELEVYGEYSWDVDSLITNPDLEIEIVENVKQSEFFNALLLTAYAADAKTDNAALKVDITPDYKNNSLKIEINITLKPGQDGLFGIAELKNQEVSLTLTSQLGLTTHCNIQKINNWDVSANLSSGFSWKVDISLYTDDWKKEEDLEGLFDPNNKFANLIDYHKNVRKITEKLNEITADVTGGEIKLFDWKLPIPSVPGLYFSAEIKLFASFELAADVTIEQTVDTIYTVGVCFIHDEFEAYSNLYHNEGDVTLSLSGRAKAKAGVKLEIKATLVSDRIANIKLVPQAGLYADLYVTFPVLGVDDITESNFQYSYFEPGVYFSAKISSLLNIGIKKIEFSKDLIAKKKPFDGLTFGNKKVAMGMTVNAFTVRAINKTVSVPDILFEYYNVKEATVDVEKLSLDKIKFVTSNGTVLTATNGRITLPETTASSSLYITATYTHTDGKTYSTIFRVLISGSILEGKVSEYTADASTGELEGATVKLFAISNKTTPIGTVRTDENGKFSFNVAKGNYILEISADGYKTLLSQQTVNDDEIKYTEHILLIDDAQSGIGSAGGRVTNALDGNGLDNVTLKLRTNWNNTEGAYYGDYTETTNSSGYYSLTGLPVGYYTVEASRNGYVTGYTNIIVLSENAKNDFDFTITPILSNNEIRIVLTWGYTPSDLDSHLIGRTPSNDTFNVYYSDKVYRYDGVEMANLDVDDTSSYGPETVTILQNIYGVYTYAVHDYSNGESSSSTALSYSGAVVRVFMGSTQVAEYHVPTDQIGTYWTVFQIDENGHIVPINSISNTKPSA